MDIQGESRERTTLVTSFIPGVNMRKDRNLEDYLSHGRELLSSPYNKVIYVPPDIISALSEYHTENNHFVPYNFEDIYLSQDRDKFRKHEIHGNTLKDTQDYFIIMNNKSELLEKAAKENRFNSENYVWIDFGIFHIFGGDKILFHTSLPSLLHKYDRMRAGSCWHPSKYYNEGIALHNVIWFFAGGIIGGNRENISQFASLCRSKVKEIIDKYETLTWEVNVWYEVYKENPNLFSLYPCDHNYSLISNY